VERAAKRAIRRVVSQTAKKVTEPSRTDTTGMRADPTFEAKRKSAIGRVSPNAATVPASRCREVAVFGYPAILTGAMGILTPAILHPRFATDPVSARGLVNESR
jgi:hypothetical protein